MYEYFVYEPSISGMAENETLTIVSPFVGTLWNEYNKSGKYEQEFWDKLFEVVNTYDPYDILFWHGTAYDLTWAIYNFTLRNPWYNPNDTNSTDVLYSLDWGLLFNNSYQYYTVNTGYKHSVDMGRIRSFGKQFSSGVVCDVDFI